MHLMHARGEGWTVYFGEWKGAPYVSLDPQGFHGWSSSRWFRPGWAFSNPSIHTGRLYCASRGHRLTVPVLLPAPLVDFWRWKIKPGGRRYVREHDEPMPAPGLDG